MRWIHFVNLVIATLIILSIGGSFLIAHKEESLPLIQSVEEEKSVPKSPFQVAEFDMRASGPLSLNWVAPQLQLPNLQNELTFHGTIERPDLASNKTLFHLSLNGNDRVYSVKAGEPFYLTYQGIYRDDNSSFPEGALLGEEALIKGNYTFSPTATPLWLEMSPQRGGRALEVTVHMFDEKGVRVAEPPTHHRFTLAAVDIPKMRSIGWEIGEYRVDSTLLIRQKARWIGKDRFLAEHGGDPFAFAADRERIDFLSSNEQYSCFTKAGDFLIWKENRWHTPKPNETTFGFPLLVVKKIEEKVILFELWDPEGKSKIALNLIRSKDTAGMPNLTEEFRFVGAKTWAQFIVEARSQRLILRAHDWLVLTSDGWVKLDSPQKIDAYVEQKISGPLLVLDKMSKKNGKQTLTGSLFNTTRTEMETIELIANSTGSLAYHTAVPSIKSEHIENQGGEE